ncbi:MAG TPA: Flp pilus assembly protein CpaB [Acidimicrobiia bacterium]|nr:Flp pilus assembly protein CpaB [Acidimicrobiia bacterium]
MLRRSPRALALRAAAVVVALVTATVVASDLAALHRRAADLGPERDAVVARHDLAVGDTIARADVGVRRIHASQLPTGVVTGAASAVGHVVVAPVLRGDFVVARSLAPAHRRGLDGVVPRGMRAIRVTVTGALRPRPGAAVDVLASFDTRDAGSGATAGSSTVVVAAGVRVLRTDARASGGTGRGDALGVTLLVDRDDAERLADAQVNGVLTLALVPPEEAASIPSEPSARS